MRVIHTHHVALYTNNVERIVAFYTEVLGLRRLGAFPGHNIVFVEAGSTAIEITEDPGRDAENGVPGWNHLALEVPDVDAAYRELSALGVPFHVLPEDFPADAPMMRSAFFRDPDGNAVELIAPLGPRYP